MSSCSFHPVMQQQFNDSFTGDRLSFNCHSSMSLPSPQSSPVSKVSQLRELLQQQSSIKLDPATFSSERTNEAQMRFQPPRGTSTLRVKRPQHRESRGRRWSADAAPYFRRYSLLPTPPRRNSQKKKGGMFDAPKTPSTPLTVAEVERLGTLDPSLGALANLVISIGETSNNRYTQAIPAVEQTMQSNPYSSLELASDTAMRAPSSENTPQDGGWYGFDMGMTTMTTVAEEVSPAASTSADSGVYCELDDDGVLREFLDQTQHLPLATLENTFDDGSFINNDAFSAILSEVQMDNFQLL